MAPIRCVGVINRIGKDKTTVRLTFDHFVRLLVCFCVSFMSSGQTTQPFFKRGLYVCRCCRWSGVVADKSFFQLRFFQLPVPPLCFFFSLSLSSLVYFSNFCLLLLIYVYSIYPSIWPLAPSTILLRHTARVVWARHLLSQLEVELDGPGRPSQPPSPTRTNHLQSWTKSPRMNFEVLGRPSVPTGSDCSLRNLTRRPPFEWFKYTKSSQTIPSVTMLTSRNPAPKLNKLVTQNEMSRQERKHSTERNTEHGHSR